MTDGGSVLIRDVSLTFPAGTFTAILGPTGAGKSTLLKTLGGLLEPSAGTVRVDGRDLYAEYATLRSRVGLVPQEDIVHTRLTARQALTYGAELRLPDATSTADRDALVESTARALGLGEHLDKRIANLSGGQRKRVSVALELLSQPSIMLLDEPTSGLDPGYEDSLMDLFRQLAEEGRTVVVVTHSTASLDRCDQVVYLGTGGWVAYCGPSELALEATGAVDQPALFRWLESGVVQHPELALPPPPDGPRPHDARVATAVELSYPSSATTQFMTLVRRNAALLLTDPRALVVAAASALIPALLLALIVGASTFSTDDPKPGQARTLLTGMIVAAGVIGAANGLREIVKDRPIYQRERVAGLRRTTYLVAKLVVLGVLTVLQAEVVVLVASILSRPGRGNIAPAHVEMLVAAATTAVACLILGLFISAMVDTSEKALAMIPVLFVTLWLFSGTVSDLSGKPLLSQLAYLAPSSWGVAAAASTVDLPEISGCATGANPTSTTTYTAGPTIVCDARWGHSLPQWSFDLVVLGLLCAVGFLLTDWALARSEHLAPLRRQHLIGSSTRWVQAQFQR
ncbi:MAG: ATP-binding cassette domain-containing protein [Actinobacteria bacterium]|nr:ATP-binding cassette domain-containing protein [Actinomycetota bacterium]